MTADFRPIIENLELLLDDNTIPKNIRSRIQSTITILGNNSETSMKVDQALLELDGIGEDNNLQAFTRTQLWNVMTMLEKVK